LSGATLLANVPQNRTVARQRNYTTSATVVLPNIADGDNRFIVVTDADNTVYEGISEGNNLGVATGVIAIRHPNLTSTITLAPAFAISEILRPSVGKH